MEHFRALMQYMYVCSVLAVVWYVLTSRTRVLLHQAGAKYVIYMSENARLNL